MITASVIFVASYVVIASGRVPLAVAAMVGASVMVLLRVLDGHEALEHIDLNVILLLGGMMTLAKIIGRTGAFDWIAVRSAQLVRGNGFGLIYLWFRKDLNVDPSLQQRILERSAGDEIMDRPLLTKSSVSHVLFILLAKRASRSLSS